MKQKQMWWRASFAALVVLGLGGFAQGVAGAPQDKRSAEQEEMSIPATGLTQANVAAVEASLRDITHAMYECKSCKTMKHRAGNCAGCDKPLSKIEVAALCAVDADVEEAVLTFSIAAGQEVRLSELEKALRAHHMTVPYDKLMLPTRTDLVLDGVASEQIAQSLAKGFENSKMFRDVKVKLDPKDKQYSAYLMRAGSMVSLDQVMNLVARLQPEVKVNDVLFRGPPPAAAG